MPSFNQARFLPAAIESVVNQTGITVSFSVMDGGSTDGSVEILQASQGRFQWRSQADGGQVNAVNSGLMNSDSQFCGYLNSDDVLHPGALEKVAHVFETQPDVDVIYGRAWFIDAAGNHRRDYPTLPFDPAVLVQHCFICQPATFWRRDVHARFGWFDPTFDNVFDYEFWLRLAVGGAKFHFLPELLASSREHEATKTSRNRQQIFSEIRRMQFKHLGYMGRNWWEQQLRFWRDESGFSWARLLPGEKDRRMYRLAWWPYVLCRRRFGGPVFYRPGDWRA